MFTEITYSTPRYLVQVAPHGPSKYLSIVDRKEERSATFLQPKLIKDFSPSVDKFGLDRVINTHLKLVRAYAGGWEASGYDKGKIPAHTA